MKFITSAWQILAGLAVLTGIQSVLGGLMLSDMKPMPNAFQWIIASNALTIAVLWFVAVRSGWRGLRLAGALFAISFGISFVNQIEGIFFLPYFRQHSGKLMLHSVAVYLLAAPVLAWIFGRRRRDAGETPALPLAPRSPAGWAWRLAVSACLYVFLYFAAGMIIFPFVREFYATQTLPSPATVISLQVLFRGPILTGICLLLMRMAKMARGQTALAVGAAFTILSGVAPLIIPVEFFPDSVRWVHFVEVTSSNFVFGALLVWIWTSSFGTSKRAAPLN